MYQPNQAQSADNNSLEPAQDLGAGVISEIPGVNKLPPSNRRQFLQSIGFSVVGTTAGALPLLSCGGGGGSDAAPSSRSILSVGGDHPYKQWYGNTGKDGLFAMYEDLKIQPYIAICTDNSPDHTSGYGATLNTPGMMSTEQAKSLQARGAEFVAHGGRHLHFWELLNTGIRVHHTGAGSSPAVNITPTELVLSTAETGPISLPFEKYAKLAALASAIAEVPGWACILATELSGNEPSNALMPLSAARPVSTDASDPTDSNQRFALCGGILIRYTGADYQKLSVSVNESTYVIELFADGALLLTQTTATTLSAIVAAINAKNIRGLTALVMDNGYAAQIEAGSYSLNPGQKFRETFCFGDELGMALRRTQQQPIGCTGVQICGGVGFEYAFRQSAVLVKERAASAHGLSITSFAQSGGHLYEWNLGDVAAEYVQWRGNFSCPGNYSGISPHALPINTPGPFVGHFTSIASSSSGLPYGESDVKAIADALADEAGWYVNWLNHLCTPTPLDASPYSGLNQQDANFYKANADQDEGAFYRELTHAASLRDAGKLDILPPTQAQRARQLRAGPANRVFNSQFRNGRRGNLLGVSTVATGMTGVACPGWNVQIAASDFSEAFVDAAGELTLTTTADMGPNKTPLGCNLFLEPGKTYDIGARLNLTAWRAGSVRWHLDPLQNGFGIKASRTFDSGYVDNAAWWRITAPMEAAPNLKLVGYRLFLFLPSSTPAPQTLKLSVPYCREITL
jgi:hypothetical protein